MKYFISLFLLFSVIQLSAQSDKHLGGVNDISEAEQKAAMKNFFVQHHASGVAGSLSSADNYDLKYHRLEFIVDPNIYNIQGAVTSYFVVNSSGFNEVDFDLTVALGVDSVLYHTLPLSFTHSTDDVLRISLPAIIPQGMLDSLTVYYHGAPSSTGMGSFSQGYHNGAPIIWTLSEPYGAKDWWPCKQDLNDKVDSMDILITTPQQYRAASNGLLVEETLNADSSKTYHWKTHYPIAAYLVAIGVTNYEFYSDYVQLASGDSFPVLNYVYPENITDAHDQLTDIVNVLKLYDSLLIDYPFAKEKYGHAQFGWGGGMEHQTMSFVGYFDHTLIAHECAHQWFGDRITLGSWEDIWLNEGFAVYLEGLTEEYLYPDMWEGWKSRTCGNVTSQAGGSVLCDDTTNVGRIFNGRLTYAKGGYLLHMLRWELGDSVFFQSLRNYLNDPNLAYNYARTADLKHHLEQTSGKDLTVFFNQWFYHAGYPSYQVTWNVIGSEFLCKIEQTQSDPSVSFFEMDVPIRLSGGGNDTTLVFHHTASGQIFSASINFTVDSVLFDPDLWILSSHNRVTYNPVFNVNNPNPELQLYIYPNPAFSEIKIYSTELVGLKEVSIYDMPGKLIRTETLPLSSLPYVIDISTLSEGAYFLKIKTSAGTVTRRVVRMR